MNNRINLDENEWVTIDVAEKCSIYSKRQIRKLAEKGNERIGSKKLKNGQVLYNLKHILQYASAHQVVPILDTVWDELDYEEYKMLVAKIRKENSQKLYKIPHLDFKPDAKYNYYMFITAEGYKAYKNGENIPLDSIVSESAERKAGDGN